MALVESAMRRHAPPPYDVTTPPIHCSPTYFSAHSTSNIPLEVNVPVKKRWSERLKLGGKSDLNKEERRDNFAMHDQKKKYGTLSGGSALSKSMKYAETWLYGTVNMRNQARPSLFMYPELPPPQTMFLAPPQPAGYALVMCSCPEFLTGTTRSKKSAAVCKKCGGSRRTTWNGSSPSSVQGFGTVRLTQPKSRPELPVFPPDDFVDPYDFMRKSRLSTSTLRVPPEGRSRAKSSSPSGRRRRRSQSPVLRHRSPENRTVERRTLNVNINEDPAIRKSILECDVNPYELLSKYLKQDEVLQQRIHQDTLLDEDDFTDDLTDGVFEGERNSRKTKGRTRTGEEGRKGKSKFGTIQSAKKNNLDGLKGESFLSENIQSGVSIGGQRIRIFNSKDNVSLQRSEDDEYFCDTDEAVDTFSHNKNESWPCESEKGSEVVKASMIPRFVASSSPKRPPRKLKTNEINKTQKKNEGVSKNRVNFSLDVPIQNRRSNSLTSSSSLEIKSILKKPNSTLNLCDGSATLTKPVSTFNGLNPNQDSGTGSKTPTGHAAKNFYLPTFKEYKHNNRKKKQVQFKVMENVNVSEDESCGILQDSTGVVEAPKVEVQVDRNRSGEDTVTVNVTCVDDDPVTSLTDVGADDPELVTAEDTVKVISTCADDPVKVHSACADDPVKLQYFGDNREDTQAVNQTPPLNPWPNLNELEEQDGKSQGTRLHRSLSDRLSPNSDKTSQFNDTMRLRLRIGRRDARDIFSEDERSGPEHPRVLSPVRHRPKEPPPPPPPLPITTSPLPDPLYIKLPLPSLPTQSHSPTNIQVTIDPPITETSLSVFNSHIAPPEPPPRQIFPFTEEQLKKINQNKLKLEESCRKRSSSTSPVRYLDDQYLQNVNQKLTNENRRTSISFPISTPKPTDSSSEKVTEGLILLWEKNSSIVNTNDEPLSTNLNFIHTNVNLEENGQQNIEEKHSHLFSKINQESKYSGETSVKVIVPPDPDTTPKQIDLGQNCTIVTVTSPTQSSLSSPKLHPNRRTSIMITGDETDFKEPKMIRTSVVIGDYGTTPSKSVGGDNKVTISVGGTSFTHQEKREVKNDFTSNVTIGPEENNSSTILRVHHSNSNQAKQTVTENKKVDNSVDAKAHEEFNKLIRQNVDPVDAARRNLVPHLCGLGKSVTEKIVEEEEERDKLSNLNQKNINNIKTNINKLNMLHRDCQRNNNYNNTTKITSQPSLGKFNSLEDDVFTNKGEEKDTKSECYVCQTSKHPSDLYLENSSELDKHDEEVEVRIGLEFDSDENHYEVIRDPIYEEISDNPPPLPLSPPPANIEIDENIPTRSIFEGATKYDILSYLEGAKERGIAIESEDDSIELRSPNHSRISSLDLSSRVSHLSNASDSSEDSCNLMNSTDTSSIISDKVRKSNAEIERNDSGVGSETSKSSRSRWQHLPASCIRADQQHSCEDCEQPVETQITDSGLMFAPLVCRKCSKRRTERRELISEIVETEEKYGRDLRIILEEFYRPMLVAGLLTPEQLSSIFLNVEELLENNAVLAEKLRDALEIAIDQGDEDLLTVNIGRIFVDSVPMLHAFESYCTRQGAASMLLANLEKEKELLRIFLRVSQMENSVLRRMNLNSFLMVPVQRVTKYPLLLARLYKVTPTHHIGREMLRDAQHKIELHLEHMNSMAKDITSVKLWRRISIINGRRSSTENDMINIKLRKVAVDVLEWNHDEVRFAVEGKLLFTQPTDNNWRRGRTIKLSPINAMLVTLGKPTENYNPDSEEPLAFPRKNGIRDASLLLLKEKSGRYGLVREPFFLDRCIVCCEADWEDYFEVQELATKDTFIFKAEDGEMTKRWFRQLQYHAQGLGAWRKRRSALANIMINGMQLRT
uniref:DH domain-containing protein n=3 Tax=Clastoptera arizonana TaxID=38151 RepID=A0A1B6EGJ1_9HEMI